jgi:hypothetical protein
MTGIAGVASNADGEGIHVINDHNKYKEWEFVYDLKKDKSALGAGLIQQPGVGGLPGTPNTPGATGAPPAGSSPFTPAPGR